MFTSTAAQYLNTDEIKSRVDLVEFVQADGVPLKRSGRLYKTCCPFHTEKTPSCVVYPETNTWFCHGACAEGGDVFKYVMKRESCDFLEAKEIVANRVGITGPVVQSPRRPPTPTAQVSKMPSDVWQSKIGAVSADAQAEIRLPDRLPALNHLRWRIDAGRGISEDRIDALIRESGLGCLYDLENWRDTGLKKEDGDPLKVYPSITIPTYDREDRLVAFQQLLRREVRKDPKKDKYKFLSGSKPTACPFIAGRNFDPSKPTVITESAIKALAGKVEYFDYNWLGMGSASYNLTAEWVETLRRGPLVYLMMDNEPDKPRNTGQEANARLAQQLGGSNVRLCVIPFGKDPDGFIREGGKLADLLAAATVYTPEVQGGVYNVNSTSKSGTLAQWTTYPPRSVEQVANEYGLATSLIVLRGLLLARQRGFMAESWTVDEISTELDEFGITERTVRTGIDGGDGVFFERMEGFLPKRRTPNIGSESIGTTLEGTLVLHFGKNPQGGRPAIQYRLRPLADAVQQLIKLVAIPRETEKHFKAKGLSCLDDAFRDALGIKDEETQQALEKTLERLFNPEDREIAAKVARKIADVVKSLSDLRDDGEPLRGDWSTRPKYHAAWLRQPVEKASGGQCSQEKMAAYTGMSRSTVERICSAHVKTERNWFATSVTPDRVASMAAGCEGKPHAVVSVPRDVKLSDGAVVRLDDGDGTLFALQRDGGLKHVTSPDGEIVTARRLRADEDTAARELEKDRALYFLNFAAGSPRWLDDEEVEARRLEKEAKRRAAEAERTEALARAKQAEAVLQAERAEALAQAERAGASKQVELLSRPLTTGEPSSDRKPPQKRYTLPGYNPAFVEVWVYRALARLMPGWGDGKGLRDQFQMSTAIEMLVGRPPTPTTVKVLEAFDPSKASTLAALDENAKPGRGRAAYLAKLTPAQAAEVLAWEAEAISEGPTMSDELVRNVACEWSVEELAALDELWNESPAEETAAEVDARWRDLRRTAAHPFNALREDAATLSSVVLQELGSVYGWTNIVESVSEFESYPAIELAA